jgi:hypothetical protein
VQLDRPKRGAFRADQFTRCGAAVFYHHITRQCRRAERRLANPRAVHAQVRPRAVGVDTGDRDGDQPE